MQITEYDRLLHCTLRAVVILKTCCVLFILISLLSGVWLQDLLHRTICNKWFTMISVQKAVVLACLASSWFEELGTYIMELGTYIMDMEFFFVLVNNSR